MHRCYMMYVGNFYFRGQRSFRGHIRFWAKKLQEFLSQELNIVEFFNLNWNNAFLCCTCGFFSHPDQRSLRGSKGQIRFSMGQKNQLFQIAKITVPMCSTWTEIQKCPR